MKKIGLLAAVLAATVVVGCNRDHTTGNATSGTPGASGTSGSIAPRSDVNFVRDVSELNGAEIDLSRMAADRSTNPEVKAFAQQAVADHTTAGDKLNRIATDNSIAKESANDDKERKERTELEAKQGPDFDRAYVDAIIDGHDKLLSKLDSRVDKQGHDDAKTVTPDKADNPVTQQINQWAADTYATTAAHLDRAKELKDTLKSTLKK